MPILDTDTSPVLDPNAEGAAPQSDGDTQDANPAQSSSADAEDAKQDEPSLRDVIQNVVKKQEAPEDSSTTEAKTEEGAEPEAKADGDDADPDADVPFHNHPRFKELVAERNAFKEDAEQYRNITTFMTESGLVAEEVAEGFEVMALLKSGSPESLTKARDWFATRLQFLDETLGHKLPDDLRLKVEDGLLDEETAKEVAQTRAKATLLQTQTDGQREQQEQLRQQQARQAVQQEMASAVTSWEADIKAKDPDYAAKKAPLVETQVRALIQTRGKQPQSQAEALEYVQTAYAKVNEMLKGLTPKPKAITPSPTGMSAAARPEPNSLRAVVEAALQR